MLDLSLRRTNSRAIVSALAIKRAGSGDSLSVRVDLAIPVADESEAETLDRVVPGSLSLFRRRATGSEDRARLNRSPSDLTVIASLREVDSGDEDPSLSVMATVERLSFVAAPKFVAAVFRLRVVVEPSVLAVLACWLDRRVEVALSTPQQVLPFLRADETASETEASETEASETTSDPDLVEVVSFEVASKSSDEQVVYGFGVVVDETPDEILVSDFGVECAVSVEYIVARVPIVAPAAIRSTYLVGANALGRTPTWADLLPAIGTEWANSAETGEPLRLRDTHIRPALGLAGVAGES